ncbi:MAG TPA: GDP-mannose 4,6-dehydratase, partial [Magnetospirillaceae bacterium]|nr:GDP-mannose 4,6-dehydratase [Magnetospirillaceae bacterium]
MKILITGITGFVGSHLADYILDRNEGHDVYGLCRWRSPRENLARSYSRISLVEADLTDLGALIRHLDAIRPDAIFHLAAQSYVLTSFNAPIQTFTSNIIGTGNLLEAVRITNIDPVIHICSSSEVYGQVRPEDVPIREDCPFKPASPYAVSKVGEDMVALQYWLSHRIRTIRTRMFTHTGPRRGDVFAMSFFAKQVAAAELGMREKV